MKDTKHGQFKDRSHQGKSSHLRWLFPFFCLTFNSFIAGSLLVMRAMGVFQIQQSLLPLLTIGGLLSCCSVGTLLLIRALRLMSFSGNQKQGFTLAIVLPVLAGMLAMLPAGGLTVTGGLMLSLVYFLAFAGVLELIHREGAKYPAAELLPFKQQNDSDLLAHENQSQIVSRRRQTDIPEEELAEAEPGIIEADNEALFEALLGQGESAQETEEIDESRENCSQWMNRATDPEGFEVVEGGTLIQFAGNQKVSVVHIGLFPALEGNLTVSCDFEFGTPIRARVLETRGFGVSVEVKRTQDLEAEFEAELRYRITNQPFQEEVA